jgi:hypothetical protein
MYINSFQFEIGVDLDVLDASDAEDACMSTAVRHAGLCECTVQEDDYLKLATSHLFWLSPALERLSPTYQVDCLIGDHAFLPWHVFTDARSVLTLKAHLQIEDRMSGFQVSASK